VTPPIFKDAIEYRGISEALELAQRTFNEESLYQALASFSIDWFKNKQRPARVLDLCSATGWAALRVARVIPVSEVTLVDINAYALEKGVSYFSNICSILTCCVDALSFHDKQLFDLILMNSAYHHIEEERKLPFLRKAVDLLAADGVILVGEHFLPPYKNHKEFCQSVVIFYTKLLKELERKKEPIEAISVIRKSGLYCWEGTYEYKVSMERFLLDIAAAGLTILKKQSVWSITDDVGSFVVSLVKNNE